VIPNMEEITGARDNMCRPQKFEPHKRASLRNTLYYLIKFGIKQKNPAI